MTDRVGQQLGTYRLLRLLGRGGFADVYLGKDVRRQMLVAVKVFHERLTDHNLKQFWPLPFSTRTRKGSYTGTSSRRTC